MREESLLFGFLPFSTFCFSRLGDLLLADNIRFINPTVVSAPPAYPMDVYPVPVFPKNLKMKPANKQNQKLVWKSSMFRVVVGGVLSTHILWCAAQMGGVFTKNPKTLVPCLAPWAKSLIMGQILKQIPKTWVINDENLRAHEILKY